MKRDWLVYTSCGVTFEVSASTAAKAISEAPGMRGEFDIVAVVLADAVVKPGPTPITVLIVGNKRAFTAVPDGYQQ